MDYKPIFKNFLDNRILFLDGRISQELSRVIIPHLLFLDNKSHDDITLCINSHGGSVAAGFAIIDMMNYIDSDVRTVCINEAESMGALILASGAKGKRYSFKDADIMIHQMSTGRVVVSENDADVEYQNLKEIEEDIFKHLSKVTHKSLSKIAKICQKDYWVTAQEAKEFGLIDKIVTDLTPFINSVMKENGNTP